MTPRPIELTWVDSMFLRTGWTDGVKARDVGSLRCHTLGYLVAETARVYVVANSVSHDGENWSHTDCIAIPKCAVVRRRLGQALRTRA